jgi:hypothetical protein
MRAVPLIIAAALLLALPVGAFAAQAPPATLTGETFFQNTQDPFPTDAQCSVDPTTGNTTYTFQVDDGYAIGPYTGLVDEQINVVIGPKTLGSLPFPSYTIPGTDHQIPGSVDQAARFQFGPLVTVTATFTVTTVDGRTITGTKTLNGTVAGDALNAGTCAEGTVPVDFYYEDVRVQNLEYEARIDTGDGTYVDEGSSNLQMRRGEADSTGAFFWFKDFIETFASDLGEPVPLQPGLGCGDLNHVHERRAECKNGI